jgi:hypothetical protein
VLVVNVRVKNMGPIRAQLHTGPMPRNTRCLGKRLQLELGDGVCQGGFSEGGYARTNARGALGARWLVVDVLTNAAAPIRSERGLLNERTNRQIFHIARSSRIDRRQYEIDEFAFVAIGLHDLKHFDDFFIRGKASCRFDECKYFFNGGWSCNIKQF